MEIINTNMMWPGIITIVITIVIAIGLFFVLREVFCWYYKINDIKRIMEEQRDLLRRLVEKDKD